MCSRRIGVLAVQGAFAEHAARLRQLGCEAVELRQLTDLAQPLDGLVLPGGESTTQAKLLRDLGLLQPLRQLIRNGLPVLGTCAGLILLAETVESTSDGRAAAQAKGLEAASPHANAEAPASIGAACSPSTFHVPAPPATSAPLPIEGFRTLPVTVRRNGYGRQLGSFTAVAPLHVKHGEAPFIPLTFIRAPRIVAVGAGVETLVALGDEPVAVRFGNQIGCCFHPELDSSTALYQLFLSLSS